MVAGKMGAVARAADAPVVLSEDDPMAKTLGYYKDASKVDVKKWPKRAAPEGKKQFCNNCQFFTADGKTQGKCQIFANKLVASKGWCNTWTAKPAA
ncbi:MAG: high-potential iron-sulfur protein [Deltaproteobacteria bacterium]|nr:high-potential iron-sulfur protein [Deltaproteobacteria bacterium]